jgi:hypothetical protein
MLFIQEGTGGSRYALIAPELAGVSDQYNQAIGFKVIRRLGSRPQVDEVKVFERSAGTFR